MMNNFDRFFLFKYSLLKNEAKSKFIDSRKNDNLSLEELEYLNWKKTKDLLIHAYETVPFYYNRFEKIGLHPTDISSEKYFYQVPILKKGDIRDNYDDFLSNKFSRKKIKQITTGGSTGIPLKVGRDKSIVREAQKWRIQSWWGVNLTDNLATVYRDLPYSKLEKLALRLAYWPQKLIKLDASSIEKKNIKRFLDKINKKKPKMVHGYVGGIDTVADFILREDITIYSPKVVWLTAAPITKIQEKKISKAFNAPVCDQYGCSEVYFISAECPKKEGLHILSDLRKIEFIDDRNQPSDSGKLLITDLEDWAFPLIRYMNGDEGRLLNKKCSCGMELPLMDKVKGRTSDNLIFENGLTVSGEYLTTIFDDFTDEVDRFQVVQTSANEMEIRVQSSIDSDLKRITELVKKRVSKKLKNKVLINTQIVDHIEDDQGKLRFIKREFTNSSETAL